MTEASAIPVPETATDHSGETPEPRLPLRQLLPQGAIAVAIAFVGVALAALSFADFGASGRALVGAVLCPVLILLAAIDARHKLLPNEIVLWSALLVALEGLQKNLRLVEFARHLSERCFPLREKFRVCANGIESFLRRVVFALVRAPHGFHADYRPSYRKETAEDAWQQLTAWFKKYKVLS